MSIGEQRLICHREAPNPLTPHVTVGAFEFLISLLVCVGPIRLYFIPLVLGSFGIVKYIVLLFYN